SRGACRPPMRLLLWFSLLRISSDLPFGADGIDRLVTDAWARHVAFPRVARTTRPIDARSGASLGGNLHAIRKQSLSTCFSLDYWRPDIAFCTRFRRNGETEMEQLFQMATERSRRVSSRAASLRNRDTPGQLADRYFLRHLERRRVDHADAVRAPV